MPPSNHTPEYRNLDRYLHYLAARITAGLSPAAVANAYFDWAVHLASSPGRQLELMGEAVPSVDATGDVRSSRGYGWSLRAALRPGKTKRQENFQSERWKNFPFNVFEQAFLLSEEWWHSAVTGVRGVDKKNAERLDFMTRQALDVFAPTNFH